MRNLPRIERVPGVTAVAFADWFGAKYQNESNAFPVFAVDPAPTACVCYNDAVALGFMQGLIARGRHPLRAVVFAALFLPALYVVVAYPMGWLGSRPNTEDRYR